MRRAGWALLAAVVAGLLTGDRAAGEDLTTSLPLPVPERPFLLLEAPRRFLPSETASVRVQLQEEGPIAIAVLRVHEPIALLSEGPARQGISIAPSALGRVSEALLASAAPLPRRGSALTLVSLTEHRLSARRGRGRVARAAESAVYDAYETDESDVETWGVRAGAWAGGTIELGRLPAGLYLVRAMRGAWASTTLLSVGRNALLVRRGDRHDEVRVLGADGAPRGGVRVEAREGASVVASGTTDREGALRLPASDLERLRFVVRDGEDVAWADVAHVRARACDPRVYVGTGRPAFRTGDVIHVRGHVRGCDESGREGALANEPLALGPGRGGDVEVRSDANGDFVAELIAPADGILRATVRGRTSMRDVTIDHRRLPERPLTVRLDRSWAAPGDTVRVEVADAEGGWPREAEVTLRTPAGTLTSAIGPARPARFAFTMPNTESALTQLSLEATLSSPGRVQTARAELWAGRRGEIVELATERTHGQQNARLPVRARASDLGGAARPGPLTVTVHGSDGNARGPERGRWEARAGEDGWAVLDVELRGRGPWWIEARRGASVASLVVRDRPGPPQLGARGELAVQPRTDVAEPGGTLAVDVRLRAGSTAWVTLEQGSVHASRLVRGNGTVQQVALEVPPEARGMAAVVATEVRGAAVRLASASVEVRSSRRFELTARADRRSYAEGERARVVLEARDREGAPRDAVVSVWLADVGWWALADERHPAPGDFFRIAGRPASAGDGCAPIAYGAEEGRHVDAWMEWDGARLERASFRHGWGYGGALVALDARGSLREVFEALARAAGLRGAEVCEEASAAHEPVHLRAQQLPWDLVALRAHERAVEGVGEEVGLAEPFLQGDVLHVPCGGSFGLIGAGGSGHGRGSGVARHRLAVVGVVREERLEGTLFFLGRIALGLDGREEIEVPLPNAPGGWRIEALAIADDGGGASASEVVHTSRPVIATLDVPARLAVGDVSEVRLEVVAPGHAGRALPLALEHGEELAVEGAVPAEIAVGADGRGALALRVRAAREGASALVARVGPAEGPRDDVQLRVTVAPSAISQPIALRAVVGPAATDVHVPLPPRLRDAVLTVRIGSDVPALVRERLEALRAPRWHLTSLRLDRLGALLALGRALEGTSGAEAEEIARAVRGEAAALIEAASADAAGDGTLSFWAGLGRSDAMTGELVWGLAPWRDDAALRAGWVRMVEALAARMDAGEVSSAEASVVAAAFARAGDRDRARRLLRDAQLDDPDALVWAVRAARALGDTAVPYGARLVPQARAMVDAAGDGAPCAGPAWFLCHARLGSRARLARAAEALLESGAPGGRELAARAAARIAERPAELGWAWGDADADVLALVARLEGEPGEVRAVLMQGERRLARVQRGGASVVVPAGAEALTIRFEGTRSRFAIAAVDGAVEVDPAHAARGSVPVVRRLVREGAARFVELELELRRDARELEVSVPLPASLELATRTDGGAIGVRASGRAFRWWGAEVDGGPEVPRMTRDERGVSLRWERIRRGRYVVRVPVIETARGTFTAGPVIVRTADAEQWGMAPPLAVQ